MTKEQKQKIQDVIELLEPVIKKMGAYDPDKFTHAGHVIENASERAKQVTAILEDLMK